MQSASINPAEPSLTTVRDLRRNAAVAPGGKSYDLLLQAHLPLVHGAASQLLPETADLVPGVVCAVFETFAVRWRKLPKNTALAAWLLKTTSFLALRQHSRQRPGPDTVDSRGEMVRAAFKRLNRLPAKQLDALALRCVLRQPTSAVASALRTKESRVEKRVARALKKLARPLRKHNAPMAPAALLATVAAPVPAELEQGLLSKLGAPSQPQPRSDLVRAALWSWRWANLRRVVRRTLAAFATVAFVLCAAGVTLVWLAQQGHLTNWFIRMSNRQLVKEIPELGESARPWPQPRAGASLAGQKAPVSSAELYNLTNIWRAKLSFSREHWQSLQPSRIRPVSLRRPDGQMQLRNPNARRSGLAGVIGIEFAWSEAQLEFGDAAFSKVAVRYRGNGTYVNSLFGPKQSFKVDLNKLVKGQQLAGVRTLNFVNAIPDFSYVRDGLAEQFFRDLGVPAPRTAYAYLTLDAPGQFNNQALGLYVLVENIDADFALDQFGSKDVPIFKPVTTELFKDLGSDWSAYAGIYDLKTKATPAQREHLIAFARLVTHSTDTEFAARVGEFLDLEEFAAFLAGHVLLSSYDGFLVNGQNFYMYLDPRMNKFGFIPWDQDHSWGEFGYIATADKRERASIWEPSTYNHRFLNRVLQVQAFRSIYQRQLEHAISELFTVARLSAQIDNVAAVIRPAVAAESDFRLKRFDLAISTNWVAGPRDGAPEGPKSPVHQLKRFIANRSHSVRAQLDGTAEGVILHRNPGP